MNLLIPIILFAIPMILGGFALGYYRPWQKEAPKKAVTPVPEQPKTPPSPRAFHLQLGLMHDWYGKALTFDEALSIAGKEIAEKYEWPKESGTIAYVEVGSSNWQYGLFGKAIRTVTYEE